MSDEVGLLEKIVSGAGEGIWYNSGNTEEHFGEFLNGGNKRVSKFLYVGSNYLLSLVFSKTVSESGDEYSSFYTDQINITLSADDYVADLGSVVNFCELSVTETKTESGSTGNSRKDYSCDNKNLYDSLNNLYLKVKEQARPEEEFNTIREQNIVKLKLKHELL
ncbi:hypothetical protein J4216_00115 [Candidatus Woesearchaeota archaeon]|nr:hypothetical protein [Candidatus Woesearchaeota archaeon]